MKRNNKCQLVGIEDLQHYECYDNGFMHYFEKEEKCLKCDNELKKAPGNKDHLKYYEEASDLDDKFINLDVFNRIPPRNWGYEAILAALAGVGLIAL